MIQPNEHQHAIQGNILSRTSHIYLSPETRALHHNRLGINNFNKTKLHASFGDWYRLFCVILFFVYPTASYGVDYAFSGYSETSQLVTISTTLNNLPAELVSPNNRLTPPAVYTTPIFGGVDSGPNTGTESPFMSNGYEGWAIPGCSGCVLYLTGSWSGWSRLRCGGYTGTNGGFNFTNMGRFNASGRAGKYNRYATPSPSGTCSSGGVTIGSRGYVEWAGMGFDLNAAVNTGFTLNAYVPMSVAAGRYQLPKIRIVQGLVDTSSNLFSYYYLSQNDYLIVPERITSCTATHPASVVLVPNIPQSSTVSWSCTGPAPTQMRVELTTGNGSLATSDGTGMAMTLTGGGTSVTGDGVIVRGTAKTAAASCSGLADNNTLYWNTPGKGGILPVNYVNLETPLSWIACVTASTVPGSYTGASILKFVYK